jgi:Zn ribbon nucleic-acid-binding protein
MSKLKPCPECKSTEVALTDEDMLNVNAFCIDCGYMGESFDAVTPTREEADETAIAAWNAISRTDYKGLAQELVTVLYRACYTDEAMNTVGDDAMAALRHAKEAGLGAE